MSLPASWIQVSLGDIGSWGSGGTPRKGVSGYYSGSIPWMKIGDLNDSVVTVSEDLITENALKDSSAKLVPVGTLLIAMYGSIGKLGIAGVPCATNQAIAFCNPNPLIIHVEFLFWQLLHQRVNLMALGQGGSQRNISQRILKDFSIDVPPIAEQRRIVAKLDGLLSAGKSITTALDDVPALLERLRQSILAAAFRGDLTADWRARNPDVEPADKLLAKIQTERRRRWEAAELAKLTAKGKPPTDDSWKERYKLPAYPIGAPRSTAFEPGPSTKWTEAPLDALCDATRGITYGVVLTGDPTPGGVPTVRCGDIKNFGVQTGNLKLVAPDVAAQFSRTRLEGGEVVIAIRGTVGATAVASPGRRSRG